MDDIRADVFGGWSVKKEKACLRLRDEMVRFGIKEGKNVIVDACNLNPKHEYRLKRLADELGCKFTINDDFLQVSPEQCIENDLHRGKDAVGSKVIWALYDKWVRPAPEKLLEQNASKRRAIIIDLDGTLCKKVTDRSYYDMTRVGEDAPRPLMSFLVDCINDGGEYYCDILFVTGRSEEGRSETEAWLEKNCLGYKALFMRRPNDKRRAEDVKEEILKMEILPKWAVIGAIDDDRRCAAMYYSQGIEVLKCGNPQE